MVLFAFVITVIVFIFSFYVIYTFERRTTIQSVEFNLQLIAGVIEQDMRDLTALGRWCGINDIVTSYFVSEQGGTQMSLNAWYRLSEEFNNNRAISYVNRLLVFGHENKRLLQLGNGISSSIPVTNWNVDSVFSTGLTTDAAWQKIIADPFYSNRDYPVIPFVSHLYNPNNGSISGTVFLAASTNLVTDKLAGYSIPQNGALYLDIGENRYQLDSNQFVPVSPDWTEAGRNVLVSYPIREGITLTQSFPQPQFFNVEGVWPVLAAALCVLFLLLVLSWSGINRMALEITVLMDKTIADEKNKKDLEYRMLQNQITPHFLHNTLNSIKWMATIQNAGGIAEMTTALSRMLQTVSKDVRKVVPLRDELLLLNDYLVIQKYRYGDSVTLEKEIADDALLDTLIPRFTLQPLIENAIFHGIEPKGAGTITVKIAENPDNAEALVTITDNGIGMKGEKGAGMGIRNVDERLRYAFGEAYALRIESEEGKYTAITIRLPRNSQQPLQQEATSE
jgi:two-component system sensor histidine kinase YesM